MVNSLLCIESTCIDHRQFLAGKVKDHLIQLQMTYALKSAKGTNQREIEDWLDVTRSSADLPEQNQELLPNISFSLGL